MKQAKRIKRWRYYLRRFAYQIKILRVLQSISREKYDEKVSASLVYGFLSAVAVNFFFQPGHVYSSGATGLAQIISALSNHWFGFLHSDIANLLCYQFSVDDFGLVSDWA